jgi:hypothetical protein
MLKNTTINRYITTRHRVPPCPLYFISPRLPLLQHPIFPRFTSSVSTPPKTPVIEEEIIPIEGEIGNYKMILSLPSQGKQVYTLPSGSIKSLLNIIKLDDPVIKGVDIYDLNERRISRSIHTQELLQSDFKLKINDTSYLVTSPMASRVIKISGKNQLLLKALNEYFSQKADDFNTISYSDYLAKAKELGFSEPEAKEIAIAFSTGGKILYLDDNIELNNTIFLHPSQISSIVETSLFVPYIRKTPADKLALLNQLKHEIAQKEELRALLDRKANRHVKILGWSTLAFLIVQSILFARLVWWDFDWGIMEPVTWFTSVVELTIGGYIYYLITRSEYSSGQAAVFFCARKFKKLCRKYDLDVDRLQHLKERVRFIEADTMISENVKSSNE